MFQRLFILIVVLALATLACGGSFTVPQAPTPGPEVVEQLTVPVPADSPARLTIGFGGGSLKLAPGASALVEGTVTYNVEGLKPQVMSNAASVQIKQKDLLGLVEPRNVKNTWDLQLGTVPMELSINAGAYDGTFELGGLALTSLTVKDGAASTVMSFNRPNQASMSLLRYETGASTVSLKGLSNANFSTMQMTAGAGDYVLDFSGNLTRDATITLSTGLSNTVLIIPTGLPAAVTVEAGFSNINAGPGWLKDGDRYTQPGTGPGLTFIIKGGAGNLTLTH